MCGEPIWGTLEEAAEEKGFDADTIQGFVDEMKKIAEEGDDDTPDKKIDVKEL
jgi:hypothetical protein